VIVRYLCKLFTHCANFRHDCVLIGLTVRGIKCQSFRSISCAVFTIVLLPFSALPCTRLSCVVQYELKQVSSPTKTFAIFSLVVNLCN